MNVSRTFNNWCKYRQTVGELGHMTTRELHDPGIDRCDIRSIARFDGAHKSVGHCQLGVEARSVCLGRADALCFATMG